MKKLVSVILVIMLCAGLTAALSETAAETEWDYIPFDVILERGIIAPKQLEMIESFISEEIEMFESGTWPEPSQEMNDLYNTVMLDTMERGCSDKAILAKICSWELAAIGIITVSQMYAVNEVIEEYNP